MSRSGGGSSAIPIGFLTLLGIGGGSGAENSGVYASATLLLYSNASIAGDTVTIGSDVYEFVATNGSVVNDSHIAVEIGVTPLATRANLINAINAVDANNQHPNIKLIDTITPAKANGTENVVAEEIGSVTPNNIMIRPSATPGGTAIVGTGESIILDSNFTDTTNSWFFGSGNIQSLAGADDGTLQISIAKLIVTQAMLDSATSTIVVDFPFTISNYILQVREPGDGNIKNAFGDSFLIVGSKIVISLNAGGGDDISNGDILTIIAWA